MANIEVDESRYKMLMEKFFNMLDKIMSKTDTTTDQLRKKLRRELGLGATPNAVHVGAQYLEDYKKALIKNRIPFYEIPEAGGNGMTILVSSFQRDRAQAQLNAIYMNDPKMSALMTAEQVADYCLATNHSVVSVDLTGASYEQIDALFDDKIHSHGMTGSVEMTKNFLPEHLVYQEGERDLSTLLAEMACYATVLKHDPKAVDARLSQLQYDRELENTIVSAMLDNSTLRIFKEEDAIRVMNGHDSAKNNWNIVIENGKAIINVPAKDGNPASVKVLDIKNYKTAKDIFAELRDDLSLYTKGETNLVGYTKEEWDAKTPKPCMRPTNSQRNTELYTTITRQMPDFFNALCIEADNKGITSKRGDSLSRSKSKMAYAMKIIKDYLALQPGEDVKSIGSAALTKYSHYFDAAVIKFNEKELSVKDIFKDILDNLQDLEKRTTLETPQACKSYSSNAKNHDKDYIRTDI